MSAALRAATVSAQLRRAGFNPLGSGAPRSREGIRVSQSRNDVSVLVDLDSDREAARLRDDVEAALAELGYAVRRHHDPLVPILTVTREEA